LEAIRERSILQQVPGKHPMLVRVTWVFVMILFSHIAADIYPHLLQYHLAYISVCSFQGLNWAAVVVLSSQESPWLTGSLSQSTRGSLHRSFFLLCWRKLLCKSAALSASSAERRAARVGRELDLGLERLNKKAALQAMLYSQAG
jgi:hypothetical protein